jgi:hypothetical protein
VCRGVLNNYKGLRYTQIPREERQLWIHLIHREMSDVGFNKKHAKAAFKQVVVEKLCGGGSQQVSENLSGLNRANYKLVSLVGGDRSEEGTRNECGAGDFGGGTEARFVRAVVFTRLAAPGPVAAREAHAPGCERGEA